MKWVTRERPKIDRIACPWLIARFIDDSPEFLSVAAERCWLSPGKEAPFPLMFPAPVELTPESAGLYAISRDLSQMFADDHEILEHGMLIYDALYAWCRSTST